MTVRFQTAANEDIPVIRMLSERIWRSHYPGIISPAQIEYMLQQMYAPAALRSEMEQPGYRYVLVNDNVAPIGYFAFRHEPAGNAVLLSKIYLLPDWHGKGIGRQMLQYVKDEAGKRGAATVYLFVNRNNTRAIRAYERFGFVKKEPVVTDIGSGFVMDDYRMTCRL